VTKVRLYFIICPLSSGVVYVGITQKGLEERFRQHYNSSTIIAKRDWIRNLMSIGKTPEIKQIREFDDVHKAYRSEKFYIKLFGRKISGEGNLMNLSKGGAGGHSFFGRKISDNHRRILSEKQKEKLKLGLVKMPVNIGRKISKERADFLKKINTGRPKTESELEKLIQANSVEKVYKLNDSMEVIEIYSGIRRASIIGKFTYTLVHRSCKSKGRKKHKGFRFMKESDYMNLIKTKQS